MELMPPFRMRVSYKPGAAAARRRAECGITSPGRKGSERARPDLIRTWRAKIFRFRGDGRGAPSQCLAIYHVYRQLGGRFLV